MSTITQSIHIKTDPATKQVIAAKAKYLGLSTASFINMILKDTASRSSLTLSLEEPALAPDELEQIKKFDADIKNGAVTNFGNNEKFFETLEKL